MKLALILLALSLTGCQYLSQHPDELKKLESDAENAIEIGVMAQGASGTTGS